MAHRSIPRPTASSSVTLPRIVAAEVLADLRAGALLDPVFERRTAGLDARDRRWLQELLWGTLRQRAWLDALLTERVRGGLARLDADVTDLLRLGVYQLVRMGSVPPYAAIGQTVELAKQRHGIGASKLVNAVLRRIDRERQESPDGVPAPALPDDPIDALALRTSHPRWLVARWVDRYGADATARLLAANNAEAPVVVRPYGTTADELRAALGEAAVLVDGEAPALWARDSLQLAPGTQLTALGAFRQGQFFVQDPASTLVVHYAAVGTDDEVADVCAAPGGKALELSRTARAVYASDVSPPRLRRVAANVERVHASNVHILAADAREPAVRPVDVVLVDAPCTGTGTFRRHPDARWRLKVSDVAVMAALQRAILRAAATVVRPGGLLVYATCSLEPEENDEQVDAFLAEHADEFTPEPPPEGAVPAAALDGGRLRVLPHVHGVDGAFAVRLRRSAKVAA